MKRILLTATISGLVLTGCATPKLYQWGSYQTEVYRYLKNETTPQEQISLIEKDLSQLSQDTKAPPGLHAHLGLLYSSVGRNDDAIRQFGAERELFPESAHFMNFLLKKSGTRGVK